MSNNAFPYEVVATNYSPIQPHTGLADQYFETVRPSREPAPEKLLMIAVLADAVTCFQKYLFAKRRRAKSVFQEAQDWIFSDNENPLFSYRNICEILDIDFQRLREGLMEWKRRQIEEDSKRRVARFN